MLRVPEQCKGVTSTQGKHVWPSTRTEQSAEQVERFGYLDTRSTWLSQPEIPKSWDLNQANIGHGSHVSGHPAGIGKSIYISSRVRITCC